MLNAQVVLDSHTIGGSTMLILFEVTWSGEHTCRQLLEHVLKSISNDQKSLLQWSL